MIDILLATFNGDKYLEEQIHSIIKQTYENWTLFIHDDGSSDNTVDLIKKFAKKYPNKIIYIEDGITFGSPVRNFSHLINFSESKYVAFCDQDDIWLPNKLSISLDRIVDYESSAGQGVPISLCSDTILVDIDLNIINRSGCSAQRIGPKYSPNEKYLAVRNYITGCTLICNRAAINVAYPIGECAVMHDWWIGLCTQVHGGEIIFVHSPLVYYRQHDNNSMGANPFSFFKSVSRILSLFTILKEWNVTYDMGKELNIFSNRLIFIYYKMLSTLRVLFV